MRLKDADGLANIGNSDQTAPLELAKTKSAVVNFGCFLYFLFSIEPGHEKMCFMSYANNKGTDQPAHPHSLISTFVVRCLDSIISLDSTAKISRLASFHGCSGRFVSGLVRNPRRHILFCRGSIIYEYFQYHFCFLSQHLFYSLYFRFVGQNIESVSKYLDSECVQRCYRCLCICHKHHVSYRQSPHLALRAGERKIQVSKYPRNSCHWLAEVRGKEWQFEPCHKKTCRKSCATS